MADREGQGTGTGSIVSRLLLIKLLRARSYSALEKLG